MSTKRRRDNGSVEVKKEEKKAKVDSVSTHVTLRVKAQDEEELRVFRMRRNVEMRKVMERYIDARGVKWNTFVFLLDGSKIREAHTPDELELKDGDQIDAMLHQGGGFEGAVVEVNRGLLKELEDMGFSMARAAWALHHSGNSSLETAVNWIVDHENDSHFDKMPLVEFNIEIESPNPHDDTAETAQARANELKERARKLREEEETKREREREKERIRAGKGMMETRRVAEENERKRNIALRKAEKAEEKRAREKIIQKVNADKAERKSRLGLSTTSTSTLVAPLDTKRMITPFPSPATKAEEMRECLRSLRRNHKEEDPRTVRRAFETLLMIVRNVAKNPDEEKYRRIRVTNRLFQERVGRFEEGMEFMELCGFKREEGSEFLCLAKHDTDISRLRDAAFQLQSAVTNPFFGLLSKEEAEDL